jgi:hypothetical protein
VKSFACREKKPKRRVTKNLHGSELGDTFNDSTPFDKSLNLSFPKKVEVVATDNPYKDKFKM